jgi:NADPH:quinone reductase
MQAAVLGEQGVEVRDLPKPTPKPNEVLIWVRASSLNRADLLVALGHQHGASAASAPGSDWSVPAKSRRSAAMSGASSPATG